MRQRDRLQAMASELRRIAAGLYDAGLKPGVSGNDAMTLASLNLWRMAEAIEAEFAPRERAPASRWQRFVRWWRGPRFA
jgi:hypothetical protein